MTHAPSTIPSTLRTAGLAVLVAAAAPVAAKGPASGQTATTTTTASAPDNSEQLETMTGSADTPSELEAILELEEDSLVPGQGTSPNSDMKNLRSRSLEEAAYTLALQRAIRYRIKELRGTLESSSQRLNKIFDFRGLMLHDGKVIPPVITEHQGSFKTEGRKTATATEHAFRILKTARIVAEPPSWRDYLLLNTPTLETVNPAILPSNADERAVWRRGAQRGWADGIREANYMFRTAVNRLRRDFAGMLRFRQLALQGVVSTPMLAEGRVGIAVNGEALALDKRTFRITRDVQFNEVKEWDPQISSNSP